MSNIYIVAYGWTEEDDEDSEVEGQKRFRLHAPLPRGYFPFALVEKGEEDDDEEEGRYHALVYDMEEERCHEASSGGWFDTLEEAKEYCEYTLLGGEMPPSLKIAEVRNKLDRR